MTAIAREMSIEIMEIVSSTGKISMIFSLLIFIAQMSILNLYLVKIITMEDMLALAALEMRRFKLKMALQASPLFL
jgi:hypothetical protein